MRGPKELYRLFEILTIQFEYHEHPPLATTGDFKIRFPEIPGIYRQHLRINKAL